MFPPMTQWPSITRYPIMALPRGFLPLARLLPSGQHGAAITGTGAVERFTRPFGPAIQHGDRLMRAGVLACQSEAVAISTSATGRGALTEVTTGRADVPLASAVGSVAGPVLVAALVADRVWEVVLEAGRVSGVELAVQSAVRNLQRDLRRGPQRDMRNGLRRDMGNGLRTGQLGATCGMAAIADLRRAVTAASTAPEGALGEAFTEAEAVFGAVSTVDEAVSTVAVEEAFAVVAEAADGDPILGLSTRSSCSAISTTALASIASFIMEAKKPMSVLSRKRCKVLSRRRSCAVGTAT